MKRFKKVELNEVSAKIAGKYVDTKFKGGSIVERNLVLNCIAHGVYMGARHAEKTYSSLWFKWFPISTNDAWIEKHAIRASNYYLRKMGYLKLEWAEQALIRATVGTGFREGFRLVE